MPGTWHEEQTIQHDGETRYFRYYVPTDMSNPAPIVFYLHGGTGCYTQIGDQMWEDAAESGSFCSLLQTAAGWAAATATVRSRTGTTAVQTILLPTPARTTLDSSGALIDWADTNFDVDLERVYSTGHSNGGQMSYRLAIELSDRIAAICAFGAALADPSECNLPAENSSPIMIVNGDAEGCWLGGECERPLRGCVMSTADTLSLWIDALNCTPFPSEVIDYPDITLDDDDLLPSPNGCTVTSYRYSGGIYDTEVMLYRVWNGGHTIPSAKYPWPIGFRAELGNQNQDIDGPEHAWDFINQFTLVANELTTKAMNPDPVNDVSDVLLDADLSWTWAHPPVRGRITGRFYDILK